MLQAAQPDHILQQHVRAMFRKVISSWAADALTLRQSGLDRPTSRRGGCCALAPASGAKQLFDACYQNPAPIRWRPQNDGRSRGRFGDL